VSSEYLEKSFNSSTGVTFIFLISDDSRINELPSKRGRGRNKGQINPRYDQQNATRSIIRCW